MGDRTEPTPEELARMLRGQPMRRLITRACLDCGHRWIQPSPTGACPACRGDRVDNVDHRVSGLPTV
jgi:hypothetical protein